MIESMIRYSSVDSNCRYDTTKNILTADFLGFRDSELECSVVFDVAKAKLEGII